MLVLAAVPAKVPWRARRSRDESCTYELGAYKLDEQLATMRKIVASTTLGSSDWHDTTVVDSDLEGVIGARKQEDGGPILVAGSRSVVQALLGAGLIDEINLQVFPLILGSGIRLYPEASEPTKLETGHLARAGERGRPADLPSRRLTLASGDTRSLSAAHVDRIDVCGLDGHHHPALPGLVVHLEIGVVLRAELARKGIVIIRLDPRPPAYLEVAIRIL